MGRQAGRHDSSSIGCLPGRQRACAVLRSMRPQHLGGCRCIAGFWPASFPRLTPPAPSTMPTASLARHSCEHPCPARRLPAHPLTGARPALQRPLRRCRLCRRRRSRLSAARCLVPAAPVLCSENGHVVVTGTDGEGCAVHGHLTGEGCMYLSMTNTFRTALNRPIHVRRAGIKVAPAAACCRSPPPAPPGWPACSMAW